MARQSKARKPARRARRSLLNRTVRTVLAALFLVALLTTVLVLPWRWLNPPTTAFMWRAAQQSEQKNTQIWLPIEAISPNVGIAVIAAEDQKFPDHYGFDIDQIRDALSAAGGAQRGASTISQQLAKNLYLWPTQSYARKVVEAYLTLAIEGYWPKRRILEVYLNIAEFGPGIYGVGAAAERLLYTPALDLSRYQAALLAAVLPSPKRMSPRDPSTYVTQRAYDIMRAAEQLGGPAYLDGL
jgi:monofunctional biosynthetic peptidoglycan transglycosylase